MKLITPYSQIKGSKVAEMKLYLETRSLLANQIMFD